MAFRGQNTISAYSGQLPCIPNGVTTYLVSNKNRGFQEVFDKNFPTSGLPPRQFSINHQTLNPIPMKNAIILLAFLLLGSGTASAQTLLQQAVAQGKVRITLKGLGGHSRQCLKLEATSAAGEVLHLLLQPGTIFHSKNPHEQDLLLAQELLLALQPGEQQTHHLNAFCIQSGNASPGRDSLFTLGDRSNPQLAKLADFVVAHGLENDPRLQSAFWCISDQHNLAGVASNTEYRQQDPLLQKLAQITNKVIPPYSIDYLPSHGEGDEAAFSNRIGSISGKLDFHLREKDVLTMALYDSFGREVKVFNRNAHFQEGQYRFHYKVDGDLVQCKGVYYLRLFSHSRMLKEITLVL